ncbi:MFS family permease [Allocatelliglobosispora scoriae]|uniref:MFS family permease n=1 Tax=Allocatelliglobosispora scoriae TaxID=643052 RepID=A0A841BK75_9ACTN|nr:MFS transporter [Allocatelliglobosispora scoriae]MBB5867748.1 MFS family permease [Allocatelliglobosispora scoriae]
MRDIPRLVWTLAAGRFVNAAGSFLFIYLFLFLTGPRALPLTTAGLISGGLGAGMLAGNLTGGWFGDRFGHRRVLLLASTVAGVTTLAVPWTPALLLAVTMPLLGYASATAGVSQGALVALAMPVGDRRKAIAVTRAAFNAGTVIGPPLGALLATHHFAALFVIDGIVTLLVRAVTARMLPAEPASTRLATAPGVEKPAGLWRGIRADRGLLLLLPAIVAVDVVYRQLYSTLPVYLRDHGQPMALYAVLISIGSGLILLLEIPAAMAMRRLPATRIIAVGYCLVGVGTGLFAFGASAAITIGAMLVLTVGEILYKTTATAHVLDRAPTHLTGQYQGLYTGAATSGTMLAAPLGALLYSHVPHALWPVCALLACAAGAAAWRSGLVGPAAPAADRVPVGAPAEPARSA